MNINTAYNLDDKHTNIMRALLRSAIFKELEMDMVASFAQDVRLKNMPKGTTLFEQNETAHDYFLIQKGWVKLHKETPEGVIAVFDVLTANETCGECAMFFDGKYPHHATTVEETTVFALPLSRLRNELESNTKLSNNLLQISARARARQNTELEHRTLQTAPQRIACFLLHLHISHSLKQHRPNEVQTINEATVTLPYDKTLIAAKLGMKPETFSRAFAKVQKETPIHASGNSIHLQNITELRQYACNACSNNFPCANLHR